MTTPEHRAEFEQKERQLNYLLGSILSLDATPNRWVIKGLRKITRCIAAFDGLEGMTLLNSAITRNTDLISGPSGLSGYQHQLPILITELLSLDGQEPNRMVRQAFERLYWFLVENEEWEAIKILEKGFANGVAAEKSSIGIRIQK